MTNEELDRIALRVLNGEYGNGVSRVQNLGEDYQEVQEYLNNNIIRLMKLKEKKDTKRLDFLKRFVKSLFK